MNWFWTLLYIMKKHKGQKDKAGKPYFLHPLHVSLRCKGSDARLAGLLHDVLEDTDTDAHDLIRKGFSKRVVDAVQCLTKPDGADYFDYVRKVKENPIAAQVKKNDLKHNMDLKRIPKVTQKDRDRVLKYQKALEILEESN